MKIKQVYDNGGKTYDRYTVTFLGSPMVLGLSHNPNSPQGFSQWGYLPKSFHTDLKNFGAPIDFDSLPETIKNHINKRSND